MTIRALIFDFDGLILETEGAIFQSWKELYESFEQELPLTEWINIIGTWEGYFDPLERLQGLVNQSLDWSLIKNRRQQRETDLILAQPMMPGVSQYLLDARRMGIKTAVASSSSRCWVAGHLERLGVLDSFDCLRTRDDVTNTKPDPELFLSAAACLKVQPCEAIALEDSVHGLVSARRAGLFCVAVPNNLTRLTPLEADLHLESLANLPLEMLIKTAENKLSC
jgi:HAD superfamily hydrolase (TIGR01509 family)